MRSLLSQRHGLHGPHGPRAQGEKTTLVERALNYLSASYVSPFSSVKGKHIRLSTSHTGFKDELN